MKYFVETYDMDKEHFTPQKGVRKGPYSLFGLRKALRKLMDMGYECGRQDPSVLVYRDPAPVVEILDLESYHGPMAPDL